ncbi:MAG: DUF4190 domain-containing protein [Oscillospiraceae bacterium]|nr:DUF4190 domain-containing protein [Oscillospiraceae bacterium]
MEENNFNGYAESTEPSGSKAMAIVSLVLGIVSIVCCICGLPFAVVGLILAILVLVKNKNGRGQAIAGLVTSIIGLIIGVYMVISLISFMPYMDEYKDFIANAPAYAEEYDEYGTYPPMIEHMIDDGLMEEEQAEQIMDQFVNTVGSAEENE